MSAQFTRKQRTLGLVLGLALSVGCSEQTDFFPDEPGSNGSGNGGQPTGGTSAASGAAGGVAGAGGATSGATNHAGNAQSGSAGSAGGGGPGGGTGGAGARGGNAGAGGEFTEAAGAAGEGGEGGNGSGAGGGGAGEGEAGSGAGTGGGGATSAGAGGEAGASCVPSTERCNGRDDDCNDATDEGNACPLGCSAKTREGKMYLFCLENAENELPTYEVARAHCEAAGTKLELGVTFELARVESAGENDFLKQWIAAHTSATGAVWHGANDLEEENIWVFGDDPRSERFFTARSEGGGTPYMDRFNDWASGRPNATNGEDEDCGAFDSEFAWQWNDVRCQVGRLGYVCEGRP